MRKHSTGREVLVLNPSTAACAAGITRQLLMLLTAGDCADDRKRINTWLTTVIVMIIMLVIVVVVVAVIVVVTMCANCYPAIKGNNEGFQGQELVEFE